MKKRIFLILVSLLSFSLPSCQKTDSEKNKILLKKADNISTLFYIRSAEELRSITRYEDCLVFISKPYCHYCEADRAYLQKYITQTNAILYEVTYLIYSEAYDDESNQIGDYAFQYPRVTGTPTYLFYKNGKLQDSHVGAYSSKESYENFVSILNKKIHPINLYMLNDFTTGNEDDGTVSYHYMDTSENREETKNLDLLGFGTENLERQINENPSLPVLYTWRRCTDCKSLHEEVLYDFLLSNETFKLSYYETDGYNRLKRMSGETEKNLGLSIWSSFSKKFHLYNEDFYQVDINGNKAGYTPTIVEYRNGVYHSMEVYLNEGNPKIDENQHLYYSTAFHEEVKNLRSDTKVEKEDELNEDYQKALKELSKKAKEYDQKHALSYLKGFLA